MDNNDSKIKSQTGGLKLMTVFIAVLALHVVVIGGIIGYRLVSGGGDSDVTTTDKSDKSTTITESALPAADKSAAPTEVASIPAATTTSTPAPAATTPDATAATPTPASDNTTSTATPAAAPTPAATPTPAPAPAPAPAPSTIVASTVAPAPAVAPAPTPALTLATPAPAPNVNVAVTQTPATTGPITSDLTPPPDNSQISTPALTPAPAPAPTVALSSGPVHMPPPNESPEVPHEHLQVYTVKITDSYKKIAERHHVTVAQLKEVNHIKGNVLHTGQKLLIPSEKSLVAERSSTSLDAAPIISESTTPITTGLTSTSTTVASTGLHHHMYTVVKGDTLTKIAHRYKVSTRALMAENDITDPTKLSIGKKLRIPSVESRSARINTPASQPSQVQAKTTAPTAQLANYAN